MSGRKNILVTFGLVLSVSLIASAITALFVVYHDSWYLFDLLNGICGELAEQEPEAERLVAAVLKEYTGGNIPKGDQKDILSTLGYGAFDFSILSNRRMIIFVMTGLLTGALVFVFTFVFRNKTEVMRIKALTDYLEQVNTSKGVILSTSGEDDFSKLEDEIYKTVTFLYQTRDEAVQVKNDFAENLSNIAHQIKTPITAISLSVQMMEQDFDSRYPDQIKKQLLRLTHLEEALLVLSRLDAGTLVLQKKEEDVFTLLVLAADNLQELSESAGTCFDIQESGKMMISVDIDWTMEALMNLMKNCMEHNEGGTIHCSYEQNPLYTGILIRDEGEGFAKEDIPRLFERFYRGKNAKEGGIGIGLALSKEIIERQNGTVRAKNMPGGGASFEIRFYSH